MKITQAISKTTVGVIVAMIFITGSLLLLSYWYSWAGVIPAVASIGGMVVWIGLWIEKEADKEAKKEEHLSDSIKLKSKLGWNILMIGIGLEIVTGSTLAAFDVSESAKHDPLKQPVNEINASLLLIFPNGANFRNDVGSVGLGEIKATLFLGETSETNLNSLKLTDFIGGPNDSVKLNADSVSHLGATNSVKMLWATFDSSEMGMSTIFKPITAASAKHWNTAFIIMPYDGKCDGGVLNVFVGSTTLRLTVLPQQATWNNFLVASSKYPPPKK